MVGCTGWEARAGVNSTVRLPNSVPESSEMMLLFVVVVVVDGFMMVVEAGGIRLLRWA